MCSTNCRFHIGWAISSCKDKTEITCSFRQWYKRVMQLRGNLDASNLGYSQRIIYSIHSFEHTSCWNRNHHHASCIPLTLYRGDFISYCLAQYKFLQAHTSTKLQYRRAETTNGTAGNFKHPGPLLVDTKLSMHRTFSQLKRSCSYRYAPGNLFLHLYRQT